MSKPTFVLENKMTFRPHGVRKYKSPEKKPFILNLQRKPATSIKAMQSFGMCTVPITLVKIPESRILTKDELK